MSESFSFLFFSADTDKSASLIIRLQFSRDAIVILNEFILFEILWPKCVFAIIMYYNLWHNIITVIDLSKFTQIT